MTQGWKDGDDWGFSELLSYDKHGNIVALERAGIIEHSWGSDGCTSIHYSNNIDALY
jgi:hypothetical protein